MFYPLLPNLVTRNGNTVAENMGLSGVSSGKNGLKSSSQQGSNVPSSNYGYSDFINALDTWLRSAMQSFDTNALAAANRAADRTNAFNANQAELNRRFQQQSAQSAMQFEADQAALDRQFQQQSIFQQQAYNSAEAEKNRQFQQESVNAAMEFEAQQAREAMAFSERMRNTQYQAAISDLKAAGLSPLLAYGNLQTAAPQGVMASSSTASGSSASSAAASGRSASGRAASGSAASGVKADTSSALQADRAAASQLLGLITLNVNSALETSRNSISLLNAMMPSISFK